MIKYPDYKNSIANFACSILNHYGIEPPNSTLAAADKFLEEKQYKNVVVILLDGMGMNVIYENLDKDGFFIQNLITSYSSTFPPTTVAATTAMMSGLYPNQSAWLGWTGYFPEIGKNVVYYSSTDAEKKEYLGYDVANTLLPYENVFDKIKRSGGTAHLVSPFVSPFPQKFEEVVSIVKELCAEQGEKYIYAYYPEPDSSMHRTGISSAESHGILRNIEKQIEKLALSLDDTLIFVTADHGHTPIKSEILDDNSELMECLVRYPSVEPRAVNFFVKDGMKEQFEKLFRERYGEQYILFSKEEVKRLGLFGTGSDHEKFDLMLGDYLAAATGNLALENISSNGFVSHHAGLTEDEMLIPLIAFSAKNRK